MFSFLLSTKSKEELSKMLDSIKDFITSPGFKVLLPFEQQRLMNNAQSLEQHLTA